MRLTADEKEKEKDEEEKETDAPRRREDTVPLTFEVLIKLLIFADMRIVPTLADTVKSLLLRKVFAENYIPVTMVNGLVEHTPRRCGLREALQGTMMFLVNRDDLRTHLDSLPSSFVAGMLLEQLEVFDEVARNSEVFKEEPTRLKLSMCAMHDKRCPWSFEK